MLFFVSFILILINTKSVFANVQQNKGLVTVDVIGESMCPDVAGFVANQLLPTFKKFRNLLQINYHPFGPFADTRCEVENARMICTCQHGPEECQKNALQACVIGALSNASDYLDIVACTQGPSGFNEAFTNCIANSTVSGKLNQNRMLQCANTDEGKLLMARHGILSRKVHENINWVPWIAINGIRIPAAEEHFEDVLCNQYFDPRPPECPSLKA